MKSIISLIAFLFIFYILQFPVAFILSIFGLPRGGGYEVLAYIALFVIFSLLFTWLKHKNEELKNEIQYRKELAFKRKMEAKYNRKK